MEKSGKCDSQQLSIKPGQYIGDCKSVQADQIMRKKLHVVMHKSDLVQFLFRQRGSLFMASREFCGGLMACLFLVVFRLAVKIFGNVMAISAKIRLGGY